MLSNRHDRKAVERELTFRPQETTPQAVLAALVELRQPSEAGVSDLLDEGATAFAVENFARRNMHVRDELAWRAAQGEALSVVERATLHALDSVLDDLEPPAPRLPTEVEEILRDARRGR